MNVSDVWDLKEKAVDRLEGQLSFSGQVFPTYHREGHLRLSAPSWDQLATDRGRGQEVRRQLDRATNHSHFALAEAYRREGRFRLDHLGV